MIGSVDDFTYERTNLRGDFRFPLTQLCIQLLDNRIHHRVSLRWRNNAVNANEPKPLPIKPIHPPKRKPRRISVAGIGDAGPKTNSMETGIIDPGYSKNKNAPLGFQRGALN